MYLLLQKKNNKRIIKLKVKVEVEFVHLFYGWLGFAPKTLNCRRLENEKLQEGRNLISKNQ